MQSMFIWCSSLGVEHEINIRISITWEMCFLFLSYLFNPLFVPVCTSGYWFYTLHYNPINTIIFIFLLNCSSFGHGSCVLWKNPSLCVFDTVLLSDTIDHSRITLLSWISHFSKKPCHWGMVGNEDLMFSVLTASGNHWLQILPDDKARKYVY